MSHEEGKKLHIVMFPWLAFGHMIPFLELSKRLAEKGHKISFISTPTNIKRLPAIPPKLSPLLTFVSLTLPRVDNLPDKAEATIDVPVDKVEYLKQAFDGLQGPLTSFLETSPPNWIIYDFAPHWLPPIAAKLGAYCAYFSIFTASVLCFFGPPSHILEGKEVRTKLEDFKVPPKWVPFPSNMALRTHEILKFFNLVEENVSGVSDVLRSALIVEGCDIIAVRSCREYEPEWIPLQEKLCGKPVIPVGMLPPAPIKDIGSVKDERWLVIREWLDNRKKETVVYIAFGSEATPTQEEITQLALGLEESNLPFFWVLRTPHCSTEDTDMLPAGFEDRTQDRGFIWRDWAPQQLILGHPSIGGFVTHCGWSSVIEGLSFGRPLILFPFINDQAVMARVLEWKKIGLEIPRNEQDGSFTKEAVAETLKMVMVDKDGECYRIKAKAMGEVFGDQVLHDRYIDDFVGYLESHASKGTP